MTNDNDIHDYEEIILVDKIRMLYKNTPFILIGSFLGSLPLALVVWNSGEQTALKNNVLVWFTLHCGLLAIRMFHFLWFNKSNHSRAQWFRYDKINLVLILMAGMIWGATGFLFFDWQDVPTYSFLILTLVCMAGGSLNALSSRPLHYMCFIIPAMAPIIILNLLQNTSFYILMGFAALIYLVFMLIFSRNLHTTIHDSLLLRQQNTRLVDNLKIQTDSANKANLDKSRFMAAASHDLRQPLHAVSLFAEVLEKEITNESHRNMLERINRGLFSMGELFDAMMEIARIDASSIPVNRSHFNLEPLIQNVIQQASINTLSSNVTLNYSDCKYGTYSDPFLLERILHNLVSNAVKYTDKGDINVFCQTNGEGSLQIHIKDSGIGIDEGDLDCIFEEFTQLNNPERDREKGLGLGLAIVKRLSDLLDHQLVVDSQIRVGTEFTIQVPLRDLVDYDQQDQVHVHEAVKLEGVHILLIDNEAEIVEATQLLLERWGCKVSSCTSSSEALKIAKSTPKLDFVISDYRLAGEMNGVDLIAAVCQLNPRIAGVIVSGDKGEDIVLQTREDQIMLLHKPVKAVQLHIALSQLIKKNITLN